jgi:PAS domain-containing protein
VPYFICPNCKQRSIDVDRKEGLYDEAVSCHHCGFGFLFELMDDYYPAPDAGFVVCDKEGRILALGRGFFELTGFGEGDLIGVDVVEGLGLTGFEEEKNPAKLSLEWGVRRLNEAIELKTRSGRLKPVKADFFPALDEDGGLLVAFTPQRA